MFTTENSN